MSFSNKKIIDYVKLIISEAAVSPGQAASKGLGLMMKPHGGGRVYVLYDATGALEEGEFMPDMLVGVLQTEKPQEPCYGAEVVSFSMAESGYGPLLYDIAMGDSYDGIVPDRGSVSGDAAGVWNSYAKRGDVARDTLDDIDNPKTPTPKDDCTLHKGAQNINLNFRYSAMSSTDVSSLITNHQKALQTLGKDLESQIESGVLGFMS